MGQYLAIGLALNYTASKKEAKNVEIAEIVTEMSQKIGFDTSLYDFRETETTWYWQLKKTILEAELPLFLELFYPVLSKYMNLSDSQEVLDMLREKPFDLWIETLENKKFYDFQIHDYNESIYLHLDNRTISISFNSIGLAMAGKIMMENTGGFFIFFEKMIQNNFPQFSIAKVLRVYIMG